jgi:tetratricopeptide (TPR) repeat protein
MRRAIKIGVGSLVAGMLIAGGILWLSFPPAGTGVSPADKAATGPADKSSEGLVYARAAVDAQKAGDLDRAIELYSQAIEEGDLKKKNLAFVYNNRGAAQRGKGLHDLAIEDYSIAVSLRPDYGRSYYNRAITYASAGSYELAIKDYDTAIGLKPDNASAFNNRALAHEKLDRHDLAIDDLSQAIRLSPDLAYAYFNRSRNYQAMDDLPRAIDDAQAAVSLRPDNSDYQAKLEELQQLETFGDEPKAVPSLDGVALAENNAAPAASDAPATVPPESGPPESGPPESGPPESGPAPAIAPSVSKVQSEKVLPPSTDQTDTQLSKAPTADPTAAVTTSPEAGEIIHSDENLILLIQGGLKEQGLDPGPLDGLMGRRTRAAIEEYQRKSGLSVDGKPSRQLLERLVREPGIETKKAEDG